MKAPRCLAALVAAASLMLAAPAFAQTGDARAKEKTLPPPADAKRQVVTGLIVKAEPATKSGDAADGADRGARSVRLTINTAAVWRDWVRDQATTGPKSKRAAASDGSKSIAASGEPASPDTITDVVVAPGTPIETRYRSATDEVSEGARAPGRAAQAEEATDPADTAKPLRGPRPGSKPDRFHLDDLKPGLWVEVHYKEAKSKEKATMVRVLRPVGGPQTPAADERPADRPR